MTSVAEMNDLFGSSSDDEEEDDEENESINNDEQVKNTSMYNYLQTFLPSVPVKNKDNSINIQNSSSIATATLPTPFQSTKNNLIYVSNKITFNNNLNNCGGGRGFIANEVIAPGTLLLAEKSFLKLSHLKTKTKSRPAIQFLKQILCDEKKTIQEISYILKELKHLHPISYVDIEKDHVEELRKEYDEDISILKNIVEKDILSKFQIDDQFYLLHICKIHFNAFPSGIYLNFAMTNHSCKPNAVKWVEGSHGNGNHSELRACEEIQKGTEITIGYIDKKEHIYKERQEYLYKQFRFKCLCNLCNLFVQKDNILKMKLEPSFVNNISKNNNNNNNNTNLNDKLIDDFIGLLNFWEHEKVYKVNIKVLEKIVIERDTYKNMKLESYNKKANDNIEINNNEYDMEVVNNNNIVIGDILLARANKLLSDKCETILVQQTVEIGSNIHLRILHILFISLLMLRESELVYISNGPHVNTAETLSRIVKVLQQFLGLGIKGRNYLINEIVYWSENKKKSMKLFTNISEASKYLRNCERTCKQIKDLYTS